MFDMGRPRLRGLGLAGILLALGSLAAPAATRAAGILRTVDLDVRGLNMAMASEANGDLHLVWRAGTGQVSEHCDIRYLHYSAADDEWKLPSLLLASDFSPCERGDGGQLVNGRTSENQPRVAVDPTTPGRAFVAFAGSPVQRTRPTLVQVDTAQNPRGMITRTVPLGSLIQEIKGVDLDVGPDGRVYVAYIHLFGDPSRNRIEVYHGASAGGGFTLEIATGTRGTGEGISVVVGEDRRPHVAGTHKRDLTHARRESVVGGEWRPAPVLYQVSRGAGVRPAMGKLRLFPRAASSRPQVYVIDALPDFVPGLGNFFYREILVTQLDDVGTSPLQPTLLHRYVFNNVAGEGGDPFAGEDLDVAVSPAGSIAVAYGIDGTVKNVRRDLGLVLTTPPQTPWPDSFQDDNGDWVDDRLLGGALDAVTVPERLPGVFEGELGRSVVAIPSAETPAVAFSGEKLWVAYLDQTVGRARVSEVEIPAGPQVPELGPLALAAALLAFGLFLARRQAAGPGRLGA
jgi:hypothetical protein